MKGDACVHIYGAPLPTSTPSTSSGARAHYDVEYTSWVDCFEPAKLHSTTGSLYGTVASVQEIMVFSDYFERGSSELPPQKRRVAEKRASSKSSSSLPDAPTGDIHGALHEDKGRTEVPVDFDASSRTAVTMVDQSNSSPSLLYTSGDSHGNSDVSNSSNSEGGDPAEIREAKSSDEEEEKEKVSEEGSGSDLSAIKRFRNFAGKVVNNPRVQLCIIILIALNALMMGIGTFDFVTDSEEVTEVFEKVDKGFLVIFTIELALQTIYHGHRVVKDPWLVFDFVVVVLSWSLESVQIVRAFRVFRAFRLVSRTKVLRNLVLAIFHVAPSMGAIVALLILILYVFGVMCTDLFRDAYRDGITSEDYFSRLDTTLFTLFVMLTMEWADVVREIMTEYYWAWGVFGSFLVLTGFILYSLVIAVICDAVQVTEHDEDNTRKEKERMDHDMNSRDRIVELQKQVSVLIQTQKQTLNAIDKVLAGKRLPVDMHVVSKGLSKKDGSDRLRLVTNPRIGQPSEVVSPVMSQESMEFPDLRAVGSATSGGANSLLEGSDPSLYFE